MDRLTDQHSILDSELREFESIFTADGTNPGACEKHKDLWRHMLWAETEVPDWDCIRKVFARRAKAWKACIR